VLVSLVGVSIAMADIGRGQRAATDSERVASREARALEAATQALAAGG